MIKINKQTKHTFGRKCDMAEISKYTKGKINKSNDDCSSSLEKSVDFY